MNRSEFLAATAREGVSEDSWSLSVDRDETYCLLGEVDSWVVYYSERGHRRSKVWHSTEEEATSDLFDRVIRDDTTRVTYRVRHKWPG